jgi:hypothetical protein
MGKKLFKPSGKWQDNATVGGARRNESVYIEGFKMAGHVLAEYGVNRRMQDFMFYPMCYCFRHAVELALKEVRRSTEDLIRLTAEHGTLAPSLARNQKGVEADLKVTHSLEKLLGTCLERLTLVSQETVPKDIIDPIVELHNVDPDGQVFRYSRARRELSFKVQENIGLVGIADVLSKAVAYLTAVGSWLDSNIEVAREMADEHSDEY